MVELKREYTYFREGGCGRTTIELSFNEDNNCQIKIYRRWMTTDAKIDNIYYGFYQKESDSVFQLFFPFVHDETAVSHDKFPKVVSKDEFLLNNETLPGLMYLKFIVLDTVQHLRCRSSCEYVDLGMLDGNYKYDGLLINDSLDQEYLCDKTKFLSNNIYYLISKENND